MDENTNVEVQESTDIPNQMDYRTLIGDLNDEAFSYLMDSFYPLFNYRVLQKEDVRRIDMMETLVRIVNPSDKEWEGKTGIRYYLFIMKQYFDEYLNCQEGSGAERYKKRVMDLLEKNLAEDADKSKDDMLKAAEDAFIVFVSLFRAIDVEFDKIGDCTLSNMDFVLRKEDADVLKKIWECEDLVPDGVSDKGGLFGFMKSDSTKNRARKLFYLNNMIFLCLGLQKRGFFEGGEQE